MSPVPPTPLGRWVEVTPSPYSHEAEGLNQLRTLMPEVSPFRAWSNVEFRDGQGKWQEVDLLLLGRRQLHLLEFKYYSGTLGGDDLTSWRTRPWGSLHMPAHRTGWRCFSWRQVCALPGTAPACESKSSRSSRA